MVNRSYCLLGRNIERFKYLVKIFIRTKPERMVTDVYPIDMVVIYLSLISYRYIPTMKHYFDIGTPNIITHGSDITDV